MNNYMNYQNPYMQRNFYQEQNYPKQVQETLYDPYQGYIRGNMFPNLYSKYKVDKPFEIQPLNEQAELLTYIDALQFAVIDLNLYLDVYPDDKQMLELYNKYRKDLNEYTSNYEQQYGPLLLSSNSLETYPWAWDNRPWPWEQGE